MVECLVTDTVIAALWDTTDKRKTPIDESTEHKMIELFYERSKPEDTGVESKPTTCNLYIPIQQGKVNDTCL